MKIGKLAQMAGCQPAAVRYYESLGLLPQPERTEHNYRMYDEGHLERLRFILNCRAIEMTLEEVHQLLYFRDRPTLVCHEIDELLEVHIDRLGERLRDLQRLEEHLRKLRSRCDYSQTARECPILISLECRAGLSLDPNAGRCDCYLCKGPKG